MQFIALGDVVQTPDGFGQVCDIKDDMVTVWVFGGQIKPYPRPSITRLVDPIPAHYGVGMVQRQAAIIRDLQKRLEAATFANAIYKKAQARLDKLEARLETYDHLVARYRHILAKHGLLPP